MVQMELLLIKEHYEPCDPWWSEVVFMIQKEAFFSHLILGGLKESLRLKGTICELAKSSM